MKRNIALSISTGLAIALILSLSLDASDEIFQSRVLPWVRPLIYVQDIGFRVAARLFPCQKEGFDTGCEAYKKIPAFLSTNALLYSIVSLPIVYFRRMKATAKGLVSVDNEGRIFPRHIRLLAGATGCVTGIAFLGLSETLCLLAIFLIVGAVTIRWLPRAGRWLILGPALFVSVFMLPICLSNPVDIISSPFGWPHDFTFVTHPLLRVIVPRPLGIAMSLSWLLSPVLLIWCDTALLIEAAKGMSARRS